MSTLKEIKQQRAGLRTNGMLRDIYAAFLRAEIAAVKAIPPCTCCGQQTREVREQRKALIKTYANLYPPMFPR